MRCPSGRDPVLSWDRWRSRMRLGLIVTMLAGLSAAQVGWAERMIPPAANKPRERLQHIVDAVIYDHDPSTSVGDRVFGDLICDFERTSPGRNSHGGPVCMEFPNGRIVAFHTNTSDHNLDGWSEYAVSEDRGRTWKKNNRHPDSYNSYRKHDGRSVWVQEGLVTENGTGVLFLSRFKNEKRTGIFVQRSFDHGETWTDLRAVDGDFIGAPAAVAVSGKTNLVLFDCDGSKGLHVLYSSEDDGRTWRQRSILPLPRSAWYGALCIMQDGRVLAGAYESDDEDHLHYCISNDAGVHWSRARRSPLDKKIRDPELACLGGKYYLHGRSGHRGKTANQFVLYQSDDGIDWDSGVFISSERGGYDGYSHNCIINKYDAGIANELMIEYSIRYQGRDTNEYVFFIRSSNGN